MNNLWKKNNLEKFLSTYLYEYFLIKKKYFRGILEVLISYLAITGALIIKEPGVYFLGMVAQIMISVWSIFIIGNFTCDIIKLHKKDENFKILKVIISFFLFLLLLQFFISINLLGLDTIDLAYKMDLKNYLENIGEKDYKIDERLEGLKNPFYKNKKRNL